MADDAQPTAPEPLDLTQFSKVEFVVNPSMIRPILATIFSLIAFGSAFFFSIVHYLSARDFIGLWVFLQDQKTLAGLAQLSALGVIVWRVIVQKIRKARENRLVTTSSVAVHTTDKVLTQVETPTGTVAALVPASSLTLSPIAPVAREAVTAASPATSSLAGS